MNGKKLVKRGQIYFADLPIVTDIQQGEQGGNRPVIIIQNDKGNYFSPTVIVAKISSQINKFDKVPTHVRVGVEEGLEKESMVLLEQVATINKNRLRNYVGIVSKAKMAEITRARNISMGQVKLIDRLPVHIREEIEKMLDLLNDYNSIISITKSNMVRKTLEQERKEVQMKLIRTCINNRINIEEVIKEDEEFRAMEG